MEKNSKCVPDIPSEAHHLLQMFLAASVNDASDNHITLDH